MTIQKPIGDASTGILSAILIGVVISCGISGIASLLLGIALEQILNLFFIQE
ncbi:MAG: hypothetical protein INQ03_14085 [Candidatus Heimdallarchaeota archaeon]|nr:hypothetical protein [Candidatus Heimdallarchaeota archaeon]